MNKKSFIKMFLLSSVVFINNISAQTSYRQSVNNGNWAPDTKAEIDNLISANAGHKKAYAVFDWDNTSIFADTQEMLFFYQIENLEFKMTPEEFKYSFLHYTDIGYTGNLEIPPVDFDNSFTSIDGKTINISSMAEDCFDDYKYFYENYRRLNPKSKGDMKLDDIKTTDQFLDFRAKMWFTYAALYKSFSANAAYTWVMYVTAPGYTSKSFDVMVEKAIDWGVKRECKKNYYDSPVSLPGRAGAVSNTQIDNYVINTIRPTPEISSLFKELEKNKIHVHVCTASLQDIVEVVATNPKYGYNLPKNRVMGLRLKKDAKGRFLPEYDISGGYVINSMNGKAININNILVKKYKANPVMIAGDSDGDYSMMTKFSGLNGASTINEYKPLQLILIVNRLKRGKIGEMCKIATGQLAGKRKDATTVVLQGRNDNLGEWIPTEKTIKFGMTENQAEMLP